MVHNRSAVSVCVSGQLLLNYSPVRSTHYPCLRAVYWPCSRAVNTAIYGHVHGHEHGRHKKTPVFTVLDTLLTITARKHG